MPAFTPQNPVDEASVPRERSLDSSPTAIVSVSDRLLDLLDVVSTRDADQIVGRVHSLTIGQAQQVIDEIAHTKNEMQRHGRHLAAITGVVRELFRRQGDYEADEDGFSSAQKVVDEIRSAHEIDPPVRGVDPVRIIVSEGRSSGLR